MVSLEVNALSDDEQIQPFGDYVLVQDDPTRRISGEVKNHEIGGLVIPETYDPAKDNKRDFNIGTIIRLGTRFSLKSGLPVSFDVSVGERVMFAKANGIEIPRLDKTFYLVKEQDLIGAIENISTEKTMENK
jgi:co-chaperonin GroES (HSP10)